MNFTRSRALSPRAVIAPMAVLLAAALFLFAGFAVAEPGPDQDRFIVKFKEGKGPQGKAALRGAGAELLVELGPQNAAAFRIPGQALAGIARNPNVEYVEVDPPRYPMAEQVPYGITMVQANPAAGGIAPGSGNPKVCIIDSGYDKNHEDLDAGVTGYPEGSNPWDVDYCGHGTHVAGTIAALGGNNKGVVGVIGDSASIDLHILKVFGSPSSACGWSYASTLVDAANRCAAAGAKIINMSLGCTGRRCSSTTENNTFAGLYADGVLPIAAAGNSGTTQYSYPASYDSVVSVAAVSSSGALASFSQRNDQVELAAPGVSVLSTVPGDAYASYNGTSMATPHAAGVAALVWSHFPTASAATIRGALQATAVDLGSDGRDNSYGYGLVQAKAAFDYLNDGSGGGGDDPDPPPANNPPTATFTFVCDGLECNFTGGGSDSDGTITSWAWTFGDDGSSNVQSPTHTYNGGGTYTVILTVTDDDGATGSASQAVVVQDPNAGGGVTLTAVGYKVKGVQHANLTWSGATSASVDIKRDGATVATTPANNGAYTDNIGNKGGGSYAYQVCEAGTSTCSATVTVSF